MSDTIILAVKAKHFKAADYPDMCNCPIAKAAKEIFDTNDVAENIYKLWVGPKQYSHNRYNWTDHNTHHALASAAGYDDTIIFNLELKEVV